MGIRKTLKFGQLVVKRHLRRHLGAARRGRKRARRGQGYAAQQKIFPDKLEDRYAQVFTAAAKRKRDAYLAVGAAGTALVIGELHDRRKIKRARNRRGIGSNTHTRDFENFLKREARKKAGEIL